VKDDSLLEERFAPEPTFVIRRVVGKTILVPTRQRPGEEASIYAINDV